MVLMVGPEFEVTRRDDVPILPIESVARIVRMFSPGNRGTEETDQLVVPVAAPLPPRLFDQVICAKAAPDDGAATPDKLVVDRGVAKVDVDTGRLTVIVGIAPAAFTVNDAVLTAPFAVAVRIAVWVAVTAATVTETDALVTPAGIIKAPGAVKLRLLLVSVAGKPVAGVCELKFKVQIVWLGPVTDVGLHTRLVNCAEGATVRDEDLETPLAEAVMDTD